jgi:hypothetical protein
MPKYQFNPSLDIWLEISDTRVLDRAMVRRSGLRHGGDVNAVTRERVCDELCRGSLGRRRIAKDRNDSGFCCCHHNWATSWVVRHPSKDKRLLKNRDSVEENLRRALSWKYVFLGVGLAKKMQTSAKSLWEIPA